MVEAAKIESESVPKRKFPGMAKEMIVNIRMSTFGATALLIRRPRELFTGTLLAEVAGKGPDL